MSDWQSKVDLKDLFDRHDEDAIKLPELVQEALNRFKQNQFHPLFKHQVTAMRESLDYVNNNPTENALNYLEARFDSFLDCMYDFGDRQHRIWIKTCF